MLTITEICTALESGKMLVGTDVQDGTTIKCVLGMTEMDANGDYEARILVNCFESNGYQWGCTGSTYHSDFEGCGWFNPTYYVWNEVASPEALPEGFVLGGLLEENPEHTDYYSDYRYEQRGMGLPR